MILYLMGLGVIFQLIGFLAGLTGFKLHPAQAIFCTVSGAVLSIVCLSTDFCVSAGMTKEFSTFAGYAFYSFGSINCGYAISRFLIK